MKKIFILLFVCASFAQHVQSQIKLTYDENALRAGDIHKTQLADFAGIGASGSNVTWDFSHLVCRGEHTGTTLKAEETPFASAFPEANIAIAENGNYFYFNVQKDFSEQCGWTTNNVVVRYDPPMRKYTFPFHYKDSLSGKFGGGTSFSVMNGEYSSMIDGFGTLKLPNNVVIKNVIRLKSTENFIEVSCNSVEIAMTKYLYYTDKFRYPLMSVVVRKEKMSDGKTNEKKYLLYNDNLASEYSVHNKNEKKGEDGISGVSFSEAEIEYKVYPNPVVDEGKVSYTLPDRRLVQIEVINTEGQVIDVLANTEEDAGEYTKTFKANWFTTKDAAYFVKMIFGNKVYLKPIVLKQK